MAGRSPFLVANSFVIASIAGQHLCPLPLDGRSRRDYPVQTLHHCMAAQAQASNSQVSLTHCMAGSNTCVGHKRGQSSGSDKQKQTADSRGDSNFIAINSSLVCFGAVQSTARRIDCPQGCFARRFLRAFWYWKDTEVLHVYYAQKRRFFKWDLYVRRLARIFYSLSNTALCIV